MPTALAFIAVYVGSFTVTAYRSVPQQTDDSPYYTSIGEHVCNDGIAVSQDFLKDGRFHYGEWVYIEGIGLKRINDTMNPRWTNRMDVWQPSYEAEHRFHLKFKERPLKVWKLKMKGA